MSTLGQLLGAAMAENRWEDYDEVWLDFIEDDRGTFAEFLEAGRKAIDAGQGQRAGLPLSLLIPQSETLSTTERREFFEVLVRCLPKERDHRNTLFALYEEEFANVPGIKVFLEAIDIKHAEDPAPAIELFHRMIRFRPGTFVFHRSGWGVGEIKELLSFEGAAIIDFQEKVGHRVAVSAIPDICELLPDDHLQVLAWREPERLREMAQSKEQSLELVKMALRTQDKPMGLSRIRELLAGSIVPTSEWSKWWSRQRNAIKRDPQVGIGGEKTPTFFLLEGTEDMETELRRRMRKKDIKGKLRLLREAISETSASEQHLLDPFFELIVTDLERDIGSPGEQLEALLFLRRHRPTISDQLPSAMSIVEEADSPIDAVNMMMRVEDQQEVIGDLRAAAGDGWKDLHIELLLGADDGPRNILVNMLKDDGRLAELDHWAREINRVSRKAPFFFLWLNRLAARKDLDNVPAIDGIPPIDFLRRTIGLLNEISLKAEHEGTAAQLLFVKRGRAHIGNKPFTVVDQCTDDVSLSEVREIYEQIDFSRALSGTIRERLLAFLLRKFPTLLSSEQPKVAGPDDSVIYATDEAIQRKRRELEEIRNEKLPAIEKAIAEAAAMGDLSENYEFVSAKEERENLNRRAIELMGQLDGVQRIDPSQAATDHVSLGSRVAVRNLKTNGEETYSVLGPWDGDPEHGVVSYRSPLGKALLDKKPGDEVDVELPEGSAKYAVLEITRHVVA